MSPAIRGASTVATPQGAAWQRPQASRARCTRPKTPERLALLPLAKRPPRPPSSPEQHNSLQVRAGPPQTVRRRGAAQPYLWAAPSGVAPLPVARHPRWHLAPAVRHTPPAAWVWLCRLRPGWAGPRPRLPGAVLVVVTWPPPARRRTGAHRRLPGPMGWHRPLLARRRLRRGPLGWHAPRTDLWRPAAAVLVQLSDRCRTTAHRRLAGLSRRHGWPLARRRRRGPAGCRAPLSRLLHPAPRAPATAPPAR
mmetsp:Transcript_61804/g.179278  ORF Transcript_61804/g.179278 Transcript_61804/m.179278 type:complete len:251 (-) Transcript_61804:610-1362(-)